MNAGSRPFCNARTMARYVAGPQADLYREWIAWGLVVHGAPFLLDSDDDVRQAPYMGARGTIDQGRTTA